MYCDILDWREFLMVLSDKDSKLFYELWFPLLDFANEELGVNPEMGKIHGAKSLDPAEVKKIANALWDNIHLIDEYLAKRGSNISEENRSIIKGWKSRIKDDFMLERHLKSGSVFISINTEEVYLVSGIISSWEEIFCYRSTPIMLSAVLIPFRDVIISDGLVVSCNVIFGRRYSGELKEIYMTAKKAGLIHKTL
jgi:hypothetical protein